MEVYLIRHTSVDVPKGVCYGFTDVPLKASFPEEAAETKKQLEGLSFDCVYSSPLSRATKLADFCGYPEAIRDERLKELNMGDWEMMRYDQINDPEIRKWFEDYLNTPTKNGESFMDLYHRVSAFLEELKQKPYQRVAIFAHGGVLICAQVFAGQVKIEEGYDNLTPYGGVIKIEI